MTLLNYYDLTLGVYERAYVDFEVVEFAFESETEFVWLGYDLMLAFVDGRLVTAVSDLKLGAAGFAEEQFVGLESELDCALESVLVAPEPGPGPAVPLWHFCPSCSTYRSLL